MRMLAMDEQVVETKEQRSVGYRPRLTSTSREAESKCSLARRGERAELAVCVRGSTCEREGGVTR